jgi:hypothetical protein
MVLLGRVDAGTTPAATNSQWVFQTSVDVTLLLLHGAEQSRLWTDRTDYTAVLTDNYIH